MKKRLLLITTVLPALTLFSQTYQQTDIELDSEVPRDKNVIYEASASIKMSDGFRCEPNTNKSAKFLIDRFGVFPPEEGILGGPATSGHDGVVGALPGELNVNELGAAVYSMPIYLPAGIGDMTPEIAITYNNQSGNGLLGWGWDLTGLSAIERTGQTMYHDGNRSAVNFVDDRFLMDGKRLMLCSGDYGGNGAIYKTEVDEMSRIESFSNGYNGPKRFVVHKQDGTVWEYGGTDDSRVEPQNANDVALKWLVNKMSDRNGNEIVFHYYENQSTGESYINHIDYTLNAMAGINAMYRVLFEYDDREDVEKGFVFSNIVQNRRILKNIIVKNMMTGAVLYDYSFSYLEPGNYSNDFRFMYYRLKSIGLTADGMKLNPTLVSWNKNSHYHDKFQSYSLNRNVFNKVPFVGDFNGDGFSDVVTVPYKTGNTYNTDVQAVVLLNNGDGSFGENAYFTVTCDKTLEWIYTVDFNGDGLDDIVTFYANNENKDDWKSKIQVYLNNGHGFTYIGEKKSSRYFTVYPGDFCAEHKVSFFLEYNNEGYSSSYTPNIVYCNDNTIVSQNLGIQAYYDVPEHVTIEDIDGDGYSEVIYMMSNRSAICKLTREEGLYGFHRMYYNNDIKSDDFLFPGDFNGDGYTDFLKYSNVHYWEVIYSDGDRLTAPKSCLNNNLLRGLTLAPQDRYYSSLQSMSMPSETIRTIDFDGDGKTDVGVFKSTGGNYYLEVGFNVCDKADNTCDFKDIRRFYLNINHSHQFVHVGNFLGHENASILGSVRSNPFTNEIPKIVSLNPHSAKFSVERITDGLGNRHGLRYEYLMPYKNESFYEYEYQWVGEQIRTIPLPVKALFADTTNNVNNHQLINKYRYKNVYYHPQGHGLLGVERCESNLLINNVSYRKNVLEGDIEEMSVHCLMLPKSNLLFSHDNLIRREQYVYHKYQSAQNDKIILPVLTIKKTLNYDCDKQGAIITSIIENIDYQSDIDDDNYMDIVNVSSVITGYDDNYTGDASVLCAYYTETRYEYDNRPTEWIVSRPHSCISAKNSKNTERVGVCELFEYSGNNPLQMTRKISLPNLFMDIADPLRIVYHYEYDRLGHVVEKSSQSPSEKKQRETRVKYGSEYNYRYPTSKINENGWENVFSYNQDYGNVTSVVDYNSFATESNADPLEIRVETTLPDGMRNIKVKRWAEGNKHAPQNAVYYIWDKTSGNAEKMTFFDKNGMQLRDVTLGLNGEPIYVDITYDDMGNIASKSKPYKSGDAVINYYYVYDSNNRLIQEISPNGIVKYCHYDKLQQTINTVSPEGVSHVVVEKYNPLGWRTQTIDIGGNVINYEYYSDGKLKSAMIGDDPNTKISYEYDNQRNVSKIKDSSYGEIDYVYNAYGEMKEKRTARQGVTTYNYDDMGNLIRRIESEGKDKQDIVTQWIYDKDKGKIGTLSKIVYGDRHRVVYGYDDLLRVTTVTETIGEDKFVTEYIYDNANRTEFVTYPSGVMIRNVYSNSGYYKSIIDLDTQKVLWHADDADAMGYITDYQVGNGLSTQMEYDEMTSLLTSIHTSSSNKSYQNLSYSYDAFGNLTDRAKFTGTQQIEHFVYDSFNRLSEIWLNNVLTGVMEYDDYGNIMAKVNDGDDVFYEAHYDEASPYAVSKIKTDMQNLTGMYQSVEYTVFDKISHITDGKNTLSIEYGYDYGRIHSVEHYDGKEKEKTYVSDCEFVTENGKKYVYTYLTGPVGVFAVCRSDGKEDKSIFYIHKDHLGSWCLVTDENGKTLQATSYDAWGNPRDDNSWSGSYKDELLCDRGFTGHEHLLSFGIINMNGRAYDPLLSMMMSPDSYIQNLDFSQNFNRYIYCYNNPLSYCDPTGEWVEWLLYGLYNGVVNVIYNLDNIDSFAEGALSFAAGFVSGCITQGFSNMSWGVQVVGNMVGTTMQRSVNSFVKRNTGNGLDFSILESKDFKNDMMYGVGIGLVSAVLNSYFEPPTDGKEGMTLGTILCKNKAERKLLENYAGKIAGNLFSGKYMFSGFNVNNNNWRDVVPYFKCVMGVMSHGLEFEGHSETLGNLFDKLLNFDFSGFMRQFGDNSNYCYSQFRSLFVKNGE